MEQKKEVGTKDSSLSTLHNTIFLYRFCLWLSYRFPFPASVSLCLPVPCGPPFSLCFFPFSFSCCHPAVKRDDK